MTRRVATEQARLLRRVLVDRRVPWPNARRSGSLEHRDDPSPAPPCIDRSTDQCPGWLIVESATGRVFDGTPQVLVAEKCVGVERDRERVRGRVCVRSSVMAVGVRRTPVRATHGSTVEQRNRMSIPRPHFGASTTRRPRRVDTRDQLRALRRSTAQREAGSSKPPCRGGTCREGTCREGTCRGGTCRGGT